MAKVYGLYNETKRQRYYGTTTEPIEQRMKKHQSGQTEALKNWNWRKDKIIHRTIAKGLPSNKATEKAQGLESKKPPPGWKTIQTGGK